MRNDLQRIWGHGWRYVRSKPSVEIFPPQITFYIDNIKVEIPTLELKIHNLLSYYDRHENTWLLMYVKQKNTSWTCRVYEMTSWCPKGIVPEKGPHVLLTKKGEHMERHCIACVYTCGGRCHDSDGHCVSCVFSSIWQLNKPVEESQKHGVTQKTGKKSKKILTSHLCYLFLNRLFKTVKS